MRQYDSNNLVIHPGESDDSRVIVDVRPAQAGWDTISFQSMSLGAGDQWHHTTGPCEMSLIVLCGTVRVESNRGHWESLGIRPDVFAGPPSALYLPRQTEVIVTAITQSEFAVAWTAADRDFPAALISASDIAVEIRGGGHATRQINSIIPPDFPCDRLVVVEVYTPGGNWSSYPPHKHDVHKVSSDGTVIEADLDEIYYYKFDRPEGYALQRIYTDPESPLHWAGHPIDAAVVARNNDVVLIPEGYHPVSSPVGYTTYYLNVLAGSAQSLAATDDPDYAWVKGTYETLDPRVPVYDITHEDQ